MSVERIRRITGTALPIRGDNIDTDRIIPARFLRSLSFEGLEVHLFADDRAHASDLHSVSDPRYASASILLVNANFGCGSSREHAPQAIRRRGIRAIMGESFSEIFFGNAFTIGVPCVSAGGNAIQTLMQAAEQDPGTILTLDLEGMRVEGAGHTFDLRLPAGVREAFLDGSWDATGLLRERPDEIDAVASSLPYVTGWPSGIGPAFNEPEPPS